MKHLKKASFIFMVMAVVTIVLFYIIGGGFGTAKHLKKVEKTPLTFAHKGVSVGVPENSSASFEKSIMHGLLPLN